MHEFVNDEVKNILEMAIEIGTKTALEEIKRQKFAVIKNRKDRRLRNTKLLLDNYNNFRQHCKSAIFDKKTVKENAMDILDELDQFETTDFAYIESIKKSCSRTAIIVEHVDKMLDIFRGLMEYTNNPTKTRKFIVIQKMYLEKNTWTVEQIADYIKTDQRQVYRDVNESIDVLSSLIFGIDGIKLQS